MARRGPSFDRQWAAVDQPASAGTGAGSSRAAFFLTCIGLGCVAAAAVVHWIDLSLATGAAAAVVGAVPVGHGRARTLLQRLRLRARLLIARYNLRVMQADIACMRSDLEALPGHIAYLERHLAARQARVARLQEALK